MIGKISRSQSRFWRILEFRVCWSERERERDFPRMRGWKGRGEEINDGTGDTDITCAPLTRSCEVSDRVLYFHCGMFDGSWEERLSPRRRKLF